jgi:hypothetical protein
MVNPNIPDENFLETEPDVEGHLVGTTNDKMPFVEDDTEGHWDGKRIDR